MQFNVRADVDRALAKLRDVAQKQVPFATSLALNDTATQTQNLLTNKLPEHFDRPTPYTMRAIGTERATKTKLQARVFVKRDQLAYLTFGIEGGTRTPSKSAIPVPVDLPVNQYGNMPRGTIAKLLARRDVFSGKVNGVGGIWQRQGLGNDAHGNKRGRLVLLVAWKPKATYRKRFPFYTLGEATIRAAFPAAFDRAIATAMRTAR